MSVGCFITLEGGEAVGKTTQSTLLAAALTARGIPVLHTREPGGSPGAELLRGILLNGSTEWTPRAETLLHFAARAEHAAKTIQPAMEAGTWVVCDRFFDSTLAYQGYGQGADLGFIASLIDLLDVTPDLTIVLDVGETVAVNRMRQRGGQADRYERLDVSFHARVRSGFREIAHANQKRCVLLDASDDVQNVHTAVMTAVWTRFPLHHDPAS